MVLMLQVYDTVLSRMVVAFGEAVKRTGNPLDEKTLYGPLHSKRAVEGYLAAVEKAKALGGKVEYGGKVSIFHVTRSYILKSCTKSIIAGHGQGGILRGTHNNYRPASRLGAGSQRNLRSHCLPSQV